MCTLFRIFVEMRSIAPLLFFMGNIKSVEIGIIHLSLLFLSVLCVLCDLIIPVLGREFRGLS